MQNDGTYTYEFDAEGNQIRRTKIADGKVTEYEFDYRNRLVKVTEKNSAGGAATKIVTFQYDAFDRRTGKLLDADANSTIDRKTAWVWDGQQVAMQLVDADGAGSAPWKLTNRYLYGEAVDLVLADEQLPSGGIGLTSVSYTTGNVLWPLFDQLGSVRDVADSNGVIRQHLVFDSFGNRLSETDYNTSGTVIPSTDPAAVDELFGYTGREWDSDVKLQYNRARWYDPAQGRWINQDPIGFAAGDVNLYRYVGNETTGATDPSGLRGWEIGGLTPGQWVWAGGVLFYEWGANGYRAGRSLVTLEAGRAMGERAVLISQNESFDAFDGDSRDWCRFSYAMAQEMTGANSIAEGGVGVDRAYLVELDRWQRGTRLSAGTGAMAGTAAGGFSVAGKFGVGVGLKPIPGTPNIPKVPLPVPDFMKRPLPNPFRKGVGPTFRGLSEAQVTRIKQALAEEGLSDIDVTIIGADMPEGYFGMTLGDEGFAINRSMIESATELSKTLKHELQHILDRKALGDPGAYGQCLEDAAQAAEGK